MSHSVSREDWSTKLDNALQAAQDTILAMADTLRAMPELAYHEHCTSRFIQNWMDRVGITPNVCAHTGVYGDIGTRPKFAIVADMDGIDINGTVLHACGHHAQLVHLLGTMLVFSKTQLPENFGLRLIATPAEEMLKSDIRNTLLCSGKVASSSGKAWMAQEGVFDGITHIISCHLADHLPERSVIIGYRTKGCIALVLSLPTQGVSRESQSLWQFILQKTKQWNETFASSCPSGSGIDSIVDLSSMQAGLITVYVTSNVPEQFDAIRTFATELAESIQKRRLNGVQILDICEAYAPLDQDPYLCQLFSKHARNAGYNVYQQPNILEGYTDLGFLSQKLAVCHPMIGGTMGTTHSPEFKVVDPYAAYVMPIQVIVNLIAHLHYLKI